MSATRHSPQPRVIRNGVVSFQYNLRVLLLIACAFIVLSGLAIWGLTLGEIPLSFGQIIDAIVGNADNQADYVINTLRLPRIVGAMVVGCALAIAGGLFQGVARNPLVSPDIIGINSGATLMAVTWIVLQLPVRLLPIAAFIGAITTAAIIYALSWRGGVQPARLILVGIGAAAIANAGSSYMMVRFPIEQTRPAIVWTMGSIYGTTWRDVIVPIVLLALLIPAAIVVMDPLRAMMLGDVVARSFGIPLESTRLIVMAIGCALAASSVAIAGPVGFVALMVPHIARMLAGPHSGTVLVFTGMLGALLVLAADLAGQFLFPVVLPVGVVTSAIGAPYFLYLLYQVNARQ